MKNYRIIEIITAADEKYYVVQKECKSLFGKRWRTYHESIDGYDKDRWSYECCGTKYTSLMDAKNIIAGFKKDKLRNIIKSKRVLTNEEIDSCC